MSENAAGNVTRNVHVNIGISFGFAILSHIELSRSPIVNRRRRSPRSQFHSRAALSQFVFLSLSLLILATRSGSVGMEYIHIFNICTCDILLRPSVLH